MTERLLSHTSCFYPFSFSHDQLFLFIHQCRIYTWRRFSSPKPKHRDGRLCEGNPVYFLSFFSQLSDGRAGLARVFLELPVLVRQSWGFFSWVWGWVRPVNYSVQLPLVVLAQGGFHAYTRGESLQTRTYVFKDVNVGSPGTAQAFWSIEPRHDRLPQFMWNGSLEAKHMWKWWRRSRCHAQCRLTRLSVTALCLKVSCLPQDYFFPPFFFFPL